MASVRVVVRRGDADADLAFVLRYLLVPSSSIEAQDGVEAARVDGVAEGSASVAAYIASEKEPGLLGSSDTEKAEVDQWTSFALYTLKPGIEGKVLRVVRESARTINQLLETRQYFAGASLTLADLFFCALLDSYVKNLNAKQVTEVAHLSSWFHRVQADVAARGIAAV